MNKFISEFLKIVLIAGLVSSPVWASYIIPSGSVTTVKLGANAVTLAKMATRTIGTPAPTGTPLSAGGFAVSASSSTFSTTNTAMTQVTNLSVGLTTTGRPVEVELLSDGATAGYLGTAANDTCIFEILSGSTVIALVGLGPVALEIPPSSLRAIDYPAAGNQTYYVKAEVISSGTCYVEYAVLVAHEL